MCFAVIWGYAAGLYLYSKRTGRNEYKFSMVIGAVCTGAVFHGLFNYFLNIGLSLLSIAGLLMLTGLSVYILKSLKKSSPYGNASAENNRITVDDLESALKLNPDNFLLNKKAGIRNIKSGSYKEAVGYLSRASKNNPGEISTRVFLVLLEMLNGNPDDYDTFRRLEKSCSRIDVYGLHRLKDGAEEVFSSCPEREKILEMFDDLIESAGERWRVKKRISNFERLTGAGNRQHGVKIADKKYLPMAFRHPGYYKDEE